MSRRSLASVRSYYFRELCAEVYPSSLARYSLDDFRLMWREANCKAIIWQKRVNNIWNHATHQWELRA